MKGTAADRIQPSGEAARTGELEGAQFGVLRTEGRPWAHPLPLNPEGVELHRQTLE